MFIRPQGGGLAMMVPFAIGATSEFVLEVYKLNVMVGITVF
jgi:hypothetical protein